MELMQATLNSASRASLILTNKNKPHRAKTVGNIVLFQNTLAVGVWLSRSLKLRVDWR